MQAKRAIALGIPLMALLGAVLSPFLSRAVQPESTVSEQRVLAAAVASCIMYAGCAILFLLGLHTFTSKLKAAYGVFCSALILFALTELQVPVGTLLGQWASDWLADGGVLIPILVAIGGMYAGVRMFAKLYDVKGPWSRPWLVAIAAVVASVLAYLLPVGIVIDSPQAAKGSDAVMAMVLVLFAACAAMVWQIEQKATAAYHKAIFWFFLAMVSFVGVTIFTMGAIILLGTASPFMQSGGSIVAQSFLALFVLKAAYEFNALGETAGDEDKWSERVAAASSVTIIDILVTAASKASSTSAIDPLMDGLRTVTSHLKPGQDLSVQERTTLVHVYQKLEHYLAEEDPVRRYSQNELRHAISHELHVAEPVISHVLVA